MLLYRTVCSFKEMSHVVLMITEAEMTLKVFFFSFSLQRMPSLLSQVPVVARWWPELFTLFLLRGMSRCPWQCRGWFLWQPREGNPAASHCHETATSTHSSRRLRKKNSKHTTVSSNRSRRVVLNAYKGTKSLKLIRKRHFYSACFNTEPTLQ